MSNEFVSTPDNPTRFYDPLSEAKNFCPSEVLSQEKGGYSGECERCKRQFVGFKRQRYCTTCQEYITEKERADKLQKELEDITVERDKLLSVIRGLSSLLEQYKE